MDGYGHTSRSSIYRNSFENCQRRTTIVEEVIRAPTPPPVIKTVYERAPTPEPEVIERITVRKQRPRVIERIIEQPATVGYYYNHPAIYYTPTVQYVPTLVSYPTVIRSYY